jgi:ABC-type nitrate/sulfonate/bicarbonate transport system substrate-binding protein
MRSKIVMMIGFMVLTAACGAAPAATSPTSTGSSAATPTEQPVLKLVVGLPAVGALQWPFFAALEKGWYKDAKIDFEQVTVSNGAQGVQGLVSGSLGIYGGSPDTVIQAIADANAPLVLTGGVVDRPLYSLVVQPEIKSYADLRGKRLGVFAELSMESAWLQLMLKSNGLNKGDYEIVAIGGTSARYAALTSKGIAGTMLSQPQDFQALRLGYKRLGLSTEVVKEIAWTSYSTSRDFAAKNEELLVRFLSVQRKANLWLNDAKNRTEAIAVLIKYTKAEQSDAEQTYDLWMANKAFTPDGAESPEAVKAMIDMMVLTTQLKSAIAIDKVLDQTYMNKAKARG